MTLHAIFKTHPLPGASPTLSTLQMAEMGGLLVWSRDGLTVTEIKAVRAVALFASPNFSSGRLLTTALSAGSTEEESED
jgi:hypothetical protein